jgi:hypothetical protein
LKTTHQLLDLGTLLGQRLLDFGHNLGPISGNLLDTIRDVKAILLDNSLPKMSSKPLAQKSKKRTDQKDIFRAITFIDGDFAGEENGRGVGRDVFLNKL